MNKYKIVEHFISINGEGSRLGELSCFIRFQGCNLSCSYCDTSWANRQDADFIEMTGEEIRQMVNSSGIRNVTLTGGEPLLQPGIGELLNLLCSDSGRNVEIETNGSRDISEFADLPERPAFTLDYKLPSSGMEVMMLISNFQYLESCDTVKFVAGSRQDLQRALTIIDTYRLTQKCAVHISPVFGKIDPAEIVDFMKENKMNGSALRLQMHKIIWNPNQRGV